MCLLHVPTSHQPTNMIRSCVFVAVFQMVLGQPHHKHVKVPRTLEDLGHYHPYQQRIPRHCWRSPHDIDLHKCCPRPSLYSDDVMDLCGIEIPPENGPIVQSTEKNPSKVHCQDGMCLMKNANLLMTNESVDFEKLKTYIDEWAAANSEFTEIILAAKPLCAKEREEDRGLPLKVCDPDRIYMCLQSHMLWNCKLREEFEECKRLREHMDECKPYFMKPEENGEKSS